MKTRGVCAVGLLIVGFLFATAASADFSQKGKKLRPPGFYTVGQEARVPPQEIPPEPSVSVYSSHDSLGGVVLGLSFFMEFTPLKTEVLSDGEVVLSEVTRQSSADLPEGVEYNASPHVSISKQPLVFRTLGTRQIEVRVYPLRDGYWAFEGAIKVESFSFSTSTCVESPDRVVIRFEVITLGGEPLPRTLCIEIEGAVSEAILVDGGTAALTLPSSVYAETMGGRSLETTLTNPETGEAVSQEVFFNKFEFLPSCEIFGGKG